MSPSLAGRLDYDPALPALRDQLTQRVPNGSVIKCEAVYDKPFWRDAGLSGQVVSDASPVRVTWDNSPPDGKPGVLLGFICGHRRARVRRASRRRRAATAVLEQLRDLLRGQGAEAEGSSTRRTGRRTSGRAAATAGYMPPGVLLDYGPALRKPVGRIHWAGTETSTIWAGYMDGAVRSGQRAAKEVLAKL